MLRLATLAIGYEDGSSRSTTPVDIVFDAAPGVTYELHAADKASFGGKAGLRMMELMNMNSMGFSVATTSGL